MIKLFSKTTTPKTRNGTRNSSGLPACICFGLHSHEGYEMSVWRMAGEAFLL
jgi:hypothetical protein